METIISIDRDKAPSEQHEPVIMNRWHPDIPMAKYVTPEEPFRVECMDWTGGQMKNDDSANDVRDVDLDPCHHLSGPIGVRGAEPGDLLEVDILDIGPFEDTAWGYTGIWRKDKAWGFLDDYFEKTAKCIWDFNGIWATSRHIPHLRFAGLTHPGIIGCLPSRELLDEWNRREADLIQNGPEHDTPLALPPEPRGVMLGKMSGSDLEAAGKEAARTIPPRENGGNCDIKNLCRGSKCFLPVYVKDAGLAVGDLHFSQGDGEITFCGAIEMPGWIKLNVRLIKDGCNKYGVHQSMFQPGPVDPDYSEFLVFEGISVDEDTGKQHYLDVTLAYKRACRNAIYYLSKFGYTGEQIYTMISCAPIEGHISSVVDIPNACVALQIPTSMFDFDIRPNADGPVRQVEPSDLAFTT
ncbi:MAG TPA: formamidase [Salinisphaeraceae bacterium]|nr:formamidase [Salinisphaeraceae bacterium]